MITPATRPGPRRLLPYGDHAVLVECADRADTESLHRRLQRPHPGDPDLGMIIERVPGARTLLLRLVAPLPADVQRHLTSASASANEQRHAAPVIIDVDYDGPDLADVAAALRISVDEVIGRHTGQTWTVAFAGFAPGFGYLQGERGDLRVPRRSDPRPRVPAGSVALADVWSGIYPRPGPGGWQLIGRTDAVLFDLDRDPVALLTPGAMISFRVR